MPSPAEVYRENAAGCEQWSERATDALVKMTFRDLAEQWLRLAVLVEAAKEKSEWLLPLTRHLEKLALSSAVRWDLAIQPPRPVLRSKMVSFSMP